jgi:LysR family hydrogen peroxide-inducible transcriptional activator
MTYQMAGVMEYHQIRYALAVAETHNFTRAAEQVYVTQPTLSQQIIKLEEELGLELFDRTTRSVQLTPAGELFIAHARTIRDNWNRLMEMADHYDQGTEKIHIGLLPTLGRTDIPLSIQNFISNYPGSQVELITNYSYFLLQKLKTHEIDIGILNTLPFISKNLKDMDIFPLEKNHIMVIMNKNHPLAGREKLCLEELRDLPILALNRTASVRVCMDQVFKKKRITPHFVCECDINTLVDLVSANMGISFLTARIANNQPNIKTVPLDPPVVTYTSVVTKKGRKLTPLTEILRKHLISSFQGIKNGPSA